MNYKNVFIVYFLLIVFFSSTSDAYAIPHDTIFGTREVRSTNLKPFFKWTGMLERYVKDEEKYGQPCTPTALRRCYKREWIDLIASLKGKNRITQLKEVNKHMNKATYILDIINWGVQDYWSTPYQFFVKDGDCEDYAIAKMMTLYALGIPREDMRVVVLQDLNLGIMHAVLVVYLPGQQPMILDNQIQQVVPHTKIHHYKPIYSINHFAWWRHKR